MTHPYVPQAWAVFKGKLTDEGRDDPASWKTRLRCALNKSLEFEEVSERAQLDISEPYKVYRLVPLSEQGQSSHTHTPYFLLHTLGLHVFAQRCVTAQVEPSRSVYLHVL